MLHKSLDPITLLHSLLPSILPRACLAGEPSTDCPEQKHAFSPEFKTLSVGRHIEFFWTVFICLQTRANKEYEDTVLWSNEADLIMWWNFIFEVDPLQMRLHVGQHSTPALTAHLNITPVGYRMQLVWQEEKIDQCWNCNEQWTNWSYNLTLQIFRGANFNYLCN